MLGEALLERVNAAVVGLGARSTVAQLGGAEAFGDVLAEGGIAGVDRLRQLDAADPSR